MKIPVSSTVLIATIFLFSVCVHPQQPKKVFRIGYLSNVDPASDSVEQPKKFELIINPKAAKQIGLTILPNVLTRADKVIR